MDRAGHRCDLVAVALAGTVGAAASGAAINVPADQPTIQAGIGVAVSGVDEVVVADGTYTGPGNTALSFGGKNITVRSASGDPTLCTIDCQGSGRAFLFDSGEGPSAVVDGFTITGGSEQFGGGLRVLSGSDPTIRNCRFIGNNAINSGGGAQIAGNGTSPTIVSCVFSGNSSQNGAGLANTAASRSCTRGSADAGGRSAITRRRSPRTPRRSRFAKASSRPILTEVGIAATWP
jgi:hypothetical protein